MAIGTLVDSDILTAINAVQINGQPITAAQFGTLMQYAALAMLRDEQESKAAIQAASNTSAFNTGATALAGFTNGATAAESAIAGLLGNQSF